MPGARWKRLEGQDPARFVPVDGERLIPCFPGVSDGIQARAEARPQVCAQARLAALSRDRSPDDPELLAARAEFAFARFEGQVSDLVANFPPLRRERLARVASMLKAGAGHCAP